MIETQNSELTKNLIGRLEHAVNAVFQEIVVSDDPSITPFKESYSLLSADPDISEILIHRSRQRILNFLDNAADENDESFWREELERLENKFVAGRCSTFTSALIPLLQKQQIVCHQVMAAMPVNPSQELEEVFDSIHRYLIAKEIDGIDVSELDIIVDPTIGQFIKGHHRVFVGTRGMLKEIVEKAKQEGRIINTSYPEFIFERAWGEKSY
ncbi:MAG TPA: hypothetical protein VGA67_06070 [Candidatus Dojkabacteria bacterium]|jgi:hypothetical protein